MKTYKHTLLRSIVKHNSGTLTEADPLWPLWCMQSYNTCKNGVLAVKHGHTLSLFLQWSFFESSSSSPLLRSKMILEMRTVYKDAVHNTVLVVKACKLCEESFPLPSVTCEHRKKRLVTLAEWIRFYCHACFSRLQLPRLSRDIALKIE